MKNSAKRITFQIDFIDSDNEIVQTIFKKYQDFNSALLYAQNQISNSNNKFMHCHIYDMYPRSLQR
jgi:hypothetical protein